MQISHEGIQPISEVRELVDRLLFIGYNVIVSYEQSFSRDTKGSDRITIRPVRKHGAEWGRIVIEFPQMRSWVRVYDGACECAEKCECWDTEVEDAVEKIISAIGALEEHIANPE